MKQKHSQLNLFSTFLIWGAITLSSCTSDRAKTSGEKINFINAEKYTIIIDNCKSGYKTKITETDLSHSLQVPKGDENCIAKLTEFTFRGQYYKPRVGYGFTSFSKNEEAVFETEDQKKSITVKVSQQLQSPVQEGDSIRYKIIPAHIRIPFSLSRPETEQSLSLANEFTNISLRIDSCSSGMNELFNMSASYIKLYTGDSGCLVKLEQFDYSGETFTIETGYSFATSAGQTTPYTGSLGRTFIAKVISQLTDPIVEGDDAVNIKLTQLSINPDETVNTNTNIVTVTVDKSAITEAPAEVLTYTFKKITEIDANALTIHYIISGDVTEGVDYESQTGSITIPAGQTSATLTVNILDDGLAESDEAMIMSITSDPNYIFYGSGQTIISDDDSGVVTAGNIFNATPAEIVDTAGEVTSWSDTTTPTYNAKAPNSARRPTKAVAVANGYDAIDFDGVDDVLLISDNVDFNTGGPYEETTLFLVFETGADVTTRQVMFESGSNFRGYNIYLDQGQVYVNAYNTKDDDAGATTPWGPKFVNSTVSPNSLYSITLKFDYPNDSLSGFLNGNSIGSVNGIGKIFSDVDNVGLGGPRGKTRFHDNTRATSGTYFQGRLVEFLKYNGTFTENDRQSVFNYLDGKYILNKPVVSVSASTSVITEGAGVQSSFIFSRANSGPNDLTVNYTISGTATDGSDFISPPLSAIIPAFSTSVETIISILDDTEVEAEESIIADITSSSSYTIDTQSASISITDDDYTPYNPPSEILWLKSREGITYSSGISVSTWADQSGNGFDAYKTNASRQPLWYNQVVSIQPGLLFDGKNDLINIDGSTLINKATSYSAKTLVFVFKTGSDVTAQQAIYKQGDVNRGLVVYIENGLLYANGYNVVDDDAGATTPWGPIYVSASITADTTYRLIMEFDATLGEIRGTLNSTPMIGSPASGVGLLFSHGNNNIRIGKIASYTRFHDNTTLKTGSTFGGYVAELLFFNSILDTAAKSDLDTYLQLYYP